MCRPVSVVLCALTAALALMLCAPVSASTRVDDLAAARRSFQDAYARASAGIIDPDAADDQALQDYPLYPYLLAARLRAALNQAGDATADPHVAEFIASYAHLPVARTVRRAWLESLARRSQWETFLAQYRDTAGDALRCQSFTARIELGRTAGLAREVARQWLALRSPPECARAFEWLRGSGELTPSLIEQRARLALDGGNVALARQLIAQLPPEQAAPLSLWAALLENPARSLDELLRAPATPVEAGALKAGWSRLAHVDPQGAKARFAPLVQARGASPQLASAYALALALPLAWSRDPAALDYFARVAPGDLDDAALEWRARAALWSQNWQLAAQSIDALSEKERQSARWRYWSARAAEQLHDAARARSGYELLLADDNFYAALAATRLNRSVTPHPQPLPLDAELLATLERRPAIERARELFLCGMRAEAAEEWRLGLESLPDAERLQAIRLAVSWGWYDQAVATATAQHVFSDYPLLYPRPYDPQVSAAARLAQLPAELVYGIIRQESLYRSDAVSSADARGLMQVQLTTARHTARSWQLPRPSVADLFDPAINTSLGAARLRELVDRFGGNVALALAGYDAGPNAVARWMPERPLDADIWIENIPYNETREYVERVLWHSLMFSWLGAHAEPLRADSWLDPVSPMPRAAGRRLAAMDGRNAARTRAAPAD